MNRARKLSFLFLVLKILILILLWNLTMPALFKYFIKSSCFLKDRDAPGVQEYQRRWMKMVMCFHSLTDHHADKETTSTPTTTTLTTTRSNRRTTNVAHVNTITTTGNTTTTTAWIAKEVHETTAWWTSRVRVSTVSSTETITTTETMTTTATTTTVTSLTTTRQTAIVVHAVQDRTDQDKETACQRWIRMVITSDQEEWPGQDVATTEVEAIATATRTDLKM